jgi:hypothetical protein
MLGLFGLSKNAARYIKKNNRHSETADDTIRKLVHYHMEKWELRPIEINGTL